MDVEQQRRRQSLATEAREASQRDHWPARARRLIEQVQALSQDWLHEPLRRSIHDFEQQLFKLADHAHDPFEQQQHFNSRLKLQQAYPVFEQHFMASLGEAFDRLGTPPPAPAAGPSNQPLSLLDTTEHELTVVLDKLVSRGETRCGPALHELSFRLAVLVGAPPLEGAASPLSPLSLAKAFRDAIAVHDLPDKHQLMLLQGLENTLLRGLGSLYGMVNKLLADDGILPELRPFPRTRQPAAPANRTGSPAAAAPPPMAEQAYDGNAVASHPPPPTLDMAAAMRSEPIAVLDSLRELLSRRPAAQAADGPTAGSGPVATTDELQLALSALQQHLTQVTDHASRELRSAQRLREELLHQLNAGKPAGAAPTRLSPEQGDTVELVAMLFEQLARQLHEGEGTHALLGGLQLPVLRMAVSDRDFFERKEHPARQWLGTVTEAAHDWLDDSGSEADRSLRAKLEQLVERASQEPPSAGLYTSLLADIQQHLTLLARKAQAAERRHVEAMQGRERLDQARQRAGELMAERFAKSPPRGLLRALLDRAWSDVLALTLLRHDEQSEAFTSQLAITDQLLGHLPITDRNQLQADVETGLQQIGMHHEEAAQVAQRLIQPGDGPAHGSGEVLSTTDLALRLKQHQRLGESQQSADEAGGPRGPAAPAAVQRQPPPPAPAANQPAARTRPLPSPAVPSPARSMPMGKPAATRKPLENASAAAPDPREIALQERLRELPFGSWFEFTDAGTGKLTQRKLAWYSPVSGRALFVTRRGQRGDEITLARLAQDIVRGRVRQVEPLKESLLDRAWHGLTGNLLRQPGRRPPSSRPGA
jgi:hypothetical protein